MNFRQLFGNYATAQKPVYMPVEIILNKKNGMFLLHVSSIFKKSVLKIWTALCVYIYIYIYLFIYVVHLFVWIINCKVLFIAYSWGC